MRQLSSASAALRKGPSKTIAQKTSDKDSGSSTGKLPKRATLTKSAMKSLLERMARARNAPYRLCQCRAAFYDRLSRASYLQATGEVKAIDIISAKSLVKLFLRIQ